MWARINRQTQGVKLAMWTHKRAMCSALHLKQKSIYLCRHGKALVSASLLIDEGLHYF
jgi:hypothetical protein